MHNNVGDICYNVIEGKTLYFEGPNQSFTLDSVFDQGTTQATIYENVGKEAIIDVLNGYNGTILAYGQTGSGKTHTMFGSDIYDEEQRGIIPRAAADIFNPWALHPDAKEFDVRCSMLEIYKENLRDLLTDEPADLKIKESPQRGIYVEGITEHPIGEEDDLMCWIEIGEQRRVWAETCHNSVSSRSHTIFMLEVRQTLSNDSECRGILNLVDLAGSEKVGKSGAQGQIFEEGTKINLSLSALGNVIHALTSNMDHIPYRDSKLTRLLQESLGGNYKTSLIVTCSPHSSQISETLSTLKFAQRAKKIKNRVQINIKNSPDQLAKVIEELREELRRKDEKISQLLQKDSVVESLQIPMLEDKTKKVKTCHIKLEMKRCKSEEKFPKRSRPEEVGEETKANVANLGNIKVRSSNDKSEETTPKNCELEQENEKLRKKVAELTKHVDNLTKENGNLEYKLRQAEIALIEEKKRVLTLEDSLNKVELSMEEYKHNNEKEKKKVESENVQLQVYENHVKSLVTALEDTEAECFKLLKEKKEKLQKEAIEVCSLTLVDYINKSQVQVPFTEKWSSDLKTAGLEMTGKFLSPINLFTSKSSLALDDKELLKTTKYATELGAAVEDAVNPETNIYLLKNQVVEAAIFNHNLKRVISFLIWKLNVERANASIKGEMGDALQKTVNSLEELMQKYSEKRQNWKQQLDKYDYDIMCLKSQLESRRGEWTSTAGTKPRLRKPINKMLFMRQSTCRVLEGTGRRLNRIFSPHGPSIPHRQLSGLDFTNLVETAVGKEKSKPEIPREELAKVEGELHNAQIELAWHKTLADMLIEELAKTREKLVTLQNQVNEIKDSAEQAIKEENNNWSIIMGTLRQNYDKELARKQGEITILHNQLAEWIVRYMNLEKGNNLGPETLKQLLNE